MDQNILNLKFFGIKYMKFISSLAHNSHTAGLIYTTQFSKKKIVLQYKDIL